MTDALDVLRHDLSVFADLGTGPIGFRKTGDSYVSRFVRNGEEIELVFPNGIQGRVRETRRGEEPRSHASVRALFASEIFGDLRKWAHVQKSVIRQELETRWDDIESPIPLRAVRAKGSVLNDVSDIDTLMTQNLARHERSIQVLLIDGPAGIGKTTLIELLCLNRADSYYETQAPLILHVKSRGRSLQNLEDLMAYSLQRLQLNVMFDQVPILARHGLVTIAVDGFDELADPSGYALAWGQLNELVNTMRGQGTLILSGRETFIGKNRLMSVVSSLKEPPDRVDAITVIPPDPIMAKDWLRGRGWNSEYFSEPGIEVLFEPDSYALRPFFLNLLAQQEIASSVFKEHPGYALSFLVRKMVAREASKLGGPVENLMSEKSRMEFVWNFLCEIAREMAGNQTDSIDETTYSWIVDTVLGDETEEEIVRLIRYRAHVLAFLVNDDKIGYRQFAHSQLQSYFLGQATIDAISKSEVPKYLRRNIFGADFLIAFSDIVLDESGRNQEKIRTFLESLQDLSLKYFAADRGSRNIGALKISCLPICDLVIDYEIRNVEIDDAVTRDTAADARISNLTINQLDIRGSNIEAVEFVDTVIGSLIVDSQSFVSPTIPQPFWLQDETTGMGEVVAEPERIQEWLDQHGRLTPMQLVAKGDLISPQVRSHDLFRLIGRACRMQQYWLRSHGDRHAARILEHPLWADANQLLEENGFLRTREDFQASGPSSTFYHIKRSHELIAEKLTDPDVKKFYAALVRKVVEIEDSGV